MILMKQYNAILHNIDETTCFEVKYYVHHVLSEKYVFEINVLKMERYGSF